MLGIKTHVASSFLSGWLCMCSIATHDVKFVRRPSQSLVIDRFIGFFFKLLLMKFVLIVDDLFDFAMIMGTSGC